MPSVSSHTECPQHRVESRLVLYLMRRGLFIMCGAYQCSYADQTHQSSLICGALFTGQSTVSKACCRTCSTKLFILTASFQLVIVKWDDSYSHDRHWNWQTSSRWLSYTKRSHVATQGQDGVFYKPLRYLFYFVFVVVSSDQLLVAALQ